MATRLRSAARQAGPSAAAWLRRWAAAGRTAAGSARATATPSIAARPGPVGRIRLDRLGRVVPIVAVVLALPAQALASGNPTTTGRSERTRPARPAIAAPALFPGSARPGRAGLEASAVALALRLGGISLGPQAGAPTLLQLDPSRERTCPRDRLAVSWSAPVGAYRVGAYVAPLGPPPDGETRRVNGVVLCRGSSFAYLGFEASWDGTRWRLNAVPASAAAETASTAGVVAAPLPGPVAPGPVVVGLPEQPPAAGALAVAIGGAIDPRWGPAIEPLAAYDPQTTCDPTAKPGVSGFRRLVLGAFPASRDLGIVRECSAEGVSEHKEGRAFDWGVNVDVPAERAMADAVLSWLFATDVEGARDAMARRLGVMYVIWDRQIWGAYRPDEGWRPYEGVSPHTDHVHLSFSWAGALAQTSFWTGRVGDVSALRGPGAGSAAPGLGSVRAGSTASTRPGAPGAAGAGAQPAAGASPPSAPAGRRSSPPEPASTSTSTTTTTTTMPSPIPVTAPPPPTLPLGRR